MIEENDEIFFVAARDDLKNMLAELRRREIAVRRLVIAGGGNIGLRLARTLEKSNQVKLIERDPRRARRVSEMLENTIVLHRGCGRRGTADRGEHRQRRCVRRAHQLGGGQRALRPCWPSGWARGA